MSKESSIKLQKGIKDNAEELQDFLADLHRWEKDLKDKEEQWDSSPGDQSSHQDLPPVRCRVSEDSTQKITTSNKRKVEDVIMKKKERISSFDYAAWDKFDADKALESPDEEDVAKITNKTGKSSGLSKTERATKLKDEGNKCYSSGRLDDAIAKYTQAVALDPTNAILPANRAMAYIKLEKYEAAEADCNRCLKLDANYIKAYLRRGSSRLKLGKRKLAAEDFRKVLELEPWNKDAKKELEKLEKNEAEKQLTHHDQETEKNFKNSERSPANLVIENSSYQKEPERKSINKNSSLDVKDTADNAPEVRVNKNKKEHGKKLVITEVDSSQGQSRVVGADSESVVLIEKLPHQRSQKPLQKIAVIDVPSEDSIPKELVSTSPSEEPQIKQPASIPKPPKATVPIQDSSVQADPSPESIVVPAVPRTSHQFSQDWQKLSKYKELAVQYLKTISPSFFRGIDLEAEVLVNLVTILLEDEIAPEQSLSYLEGLAQSDGFSVNLMFLDSSQKNVLHEIMDKCKEVKRGSTLFEKIKASLV